jgi:hypothetical protein
MELLVVSSVGSAFEPGTSSSGQRVQLFSADWPIAEANLRCHACTLRLPLREAVHPMR